MEQAVVLSIPPSATERALVTLVVTRPAFVADLGGRS